MLLRSSSVPSLGALVAEGFDRHDPRCLACTISHRSSSSSRALSFGTNTSSRTVLSLKPSLPLRTACSEADLQSLVCVAGAAAHRHKAGEQSTNHPKPHDSHEKLSIDVQNLPIFYSLADQEPCPSFTVPLLASSGGGLVGRDGNGSGHGGSLGPSGSSYGDSDLTDLRYSKLLQADPQNPLLLRNYAQYLSETKRDYKSAEEYYKRAILACPSDGEVLSTYAKHVWDVHKDIQRAGSYYEQAVKATPEDCYVLGSYASFLWQCNEDEVTAEASQPECPFFHGTCTSVMTASA